MGFPLNSGLDMHHQKACLYICTLIQKSKKTLCRSCAKTVDEYLTSIEKYPSQKEKDQILNPVWHVHNGKPQRRKSSCLFRCY